jgi:DNA-binding transcriptional MerR regulator
MMPPSGAMTIGKLARAAGAKVETVRWYEKVGLLAPPSRTRGNYRAYEGADLARLSFIRRARDLGFSIEQIRTLLDLSDDRGRDCGAVDEIANARLRDIDRKIADLQALRHELAGTLASCRGGVVAQCRVSEALGPGLPMGEKPALGQNGEYWATRA